MSRKLQKGMRRARKVADRKRRRGSSEARVDKHDGDMSAVYEQNRMLRRSVACAERNMRKTARVVSGELIAIPARARRFKLAKERFRAYRRKHGLARAFA